MKQFKPLWLPEGSVRAVLALGVLGSIIYLATAGQNETAVGGLVACLVLIRDYFTARGSA